MRTLLTRRMRGDRARAWLRRSWHALRQKMTRTSPWSISILVAVFLIIAIPLLTFVPQWQTASIRQDAARLEREDNARRTLAQIMGGAVGLIVIWITWRRLQVAQEGQVTERFSRAIEHLGNKESLDVRLGAIYALERIARDSRQDHGPIMEILTAYVRERAPLPEDEQQGDEAPRMRTDIQAALTVIGRRNIDYDPPGQRLNLTYTDLRRAHLDFADLQGALLAESNLYGTLLIGAKLRRTSLAGANLLAAALVGAKLQGATITKTKFHGTLLWEAELQGVDLRGAIGLTSEQLVKAKGDEDTKLPAGVERPDHWPAEREDG